MRDGKFWARQRSGERYFLSYHECWKSIRVWNPKVWGLIPHGDSEFLLCPMLVIRQKYLFYFFIKLKTYHLSYYFIKMVLLTSLILAVCRMYVIIIWTCDGLCSSPLCGLVTEYWSTESEGLMFYSSWGLRILFFVPHSRQDKKHLSLFYLLAMQKSQAHLLCKTLRKSTCDLFFIHFFLSSSFFFLFMFFSGKCHTPGLFKIYPCWWSWSH